MFFKPCSKGLFALGTDRTRTRAAGPLGALQAREALIQKSGFKSISYFMQPRAMVSQVECLR